MKDEVTRLGREGQIEEQVAEVRGPSSNELKATTVLEFSIEEVSSKVRSGPPLDDENDYGFPVWAGVLPLEIRSRSPIPDNQLLKGVAPADYVLRYDARLRGTAWRSSDSQRPQNDLPAL